MKLYRAFGDQNLNKLFDFYVSDKKGTYGFGMYFAFQKEIARIWAVMRNIRKLGVIEEYEVSLPEKSLLINQKGINTEYDYLFAKYEQDKLLYWNELKKFYETFDVIIEENKEVCLKKEVFLDLISFSLIVHDCSNFTAKDLYEATKLGELISDKEIINIPAEGVLLLQKWIQEQDLT